MLPAQSPLYCSVIGRGEPIVFVHGDSLFGNPVDHWINQLDLADEYQLIIPARYGYYLSPLPELKPLMSMHKQLLICLERERIS